jgi:hypothetical protein
MKRFFFLCFLVLLPRDERRGRKTARLVTSTSWWRAIGGIFSFYYIWTTYLWHFASIVCDFQRQSIFEGKGFFCSWLFFRYLGALVFFRLAHWLLLWRLLRLLFSRHFMFIDLPTRRGTWRVITSTSWWRAPNRGRVIAAKQEHSCIVFHYFRDAHDFSTPSVLKARPSL